MIVVKRAGAVRTTARWGLIKTDDDSEGNIVQAVSIVAKNNWCEKLATL